ncbi:MAG TPA: CmcJ/NvfI family oxidoreductase [Candidatus Acidoferrum sp.]|nr:CmcJ/NvfI family oxidoreductase [Candidatus Acidoferrum sp.]
MDGDRQIQLDAITATMTYLVPTGKKPVSYQYDPPPGVPVRSGTYEDRSVPVYNARLLADGLSLDREGFAIVPHATRAKDLSDDDEVRAVYYAEVEQLLKQATGANRVVIFDHTIRSASLAGTGRKGIREPVKRVHNDYTVKSGPQRVRDLLPDEAEELLKHRFAIINVWRPLRRTVEDKPLGLLDARTLAPQDLIATDLVYPDRVGETYAVAYNPAHRWFYYPRQRPDEAVLLKCYDSKQDGRARFPAHSAFDDPTARPDAPPRESIEIRTLVFFPPEH